MSEPLKKKVNLGFRFELSFGDSVLFSVVIPFVVLLLAFLFLCCCFFVLFVLAGDLSHKGFDPEFLFLFLFSCFLC